MSPPSTSVNNGLLFAQPGTGVFTLNALYPCGKPGSLFSNIAGVWLTGTFTHQTRSCRFFFILQSLTQ